ncbi:MAG: polyprenyl synthetase family protein [Planctomycetota bacterium]|jgi:geranylgeranyl pyrophosphate synthase
MTTNFTATTRPYRPPQDNIPKTKQFRDKLRQIAEEYVQQQKLVGPLSLNELRKHCETIIKSTDINSAHLDFLAVLVNNEIWRKTVAGVPYNKRLLLLPKCLRDNENCSASFDQLGLLCENCGKCLIGDIKTQAEELGYAVLIAEGSPIVMSLVETGRIEAVIGVSCFTVLEKTFPYMEAGAVPGIAIPLLYDGCVNTNVDVDWVLDAIYENSTDSRNRLDLKDLRDKVNKLFTTDSLKSILAPGDGQTEKLALKWMVASGKRWRPFLAVCAHHAIAPETDMTFSGDLCKMAVAIECFHKASLIHDDIEDEDLLRYGQKTLHAEFGIPIALNVGDFLLGEGYHLLTQLKFSQNQRAKMLQVAATGHRELCLGQGKELSWMRSPEPLSINEVIDIFKKKTSPAFEVALKLGVLSAENSSKLDNLLTEYSKALGIAYQIRDDINDFDSTKKPGDNAQKRPSLLFAIAWEQAKQSDRKALESLWKTSVDSRAAKQAVSEIIVRLRAKTLAFNLLEFYKHQAISSLKPLDNITLKGLLRRIISKIFNEIDIMSCCNDYKTGNA